MNALSAARFTTPILGAAVLLLVVLPVIQLKWRMVMIRADLGQEGFR